MFFIVASISIVIGFIIGYLMQAQPLKARIIDSLADMGYLRYELKPDGTKDIFKIDGTREWYGKAYHYDTAAVDRFSLPVNARLSRLCDSYP